MVAICGLAVVALPFPSLLPMSLFSLDYLCPAYRDAYGRINAMVIVGEGLAYRHFRLLAAAFPEQARELKHLAAMEAGHARAFVGCGLHLGIQPELALARSLFAPLHGLFLEARAQADRVGQVVIQCLIVECFAVAAYSAYLPVADAYAQPITARVMADEGKHLDFGERWLRPQIVAVGGTVIAWCTRAIPVILAILSPLRADVIAIGMDPGELVGEFSALLSESLGRIGLSPEQVRRLLAAGAAPWLAGSAA